MVVISVYSTPSWVLCCSLRLLVCWAASVCVCLLQQPQYSYLCVPANRKEREVGTQRKHIPLSAPAIQSLSLSVSLSHAHTNTHTNTHTNPGLSVCSRVIGRFLHASVCISFISVTACVWVFSTSFSFGTCTHSSSTLLKTLKQNLLVVIMKRGFSLKWNKAILNTHIKLMECGCWTCRISSFNRDGQWPAPLRRNPSRLRRSGQGIPSIPLGLWCGHANTQTHMHT